MRRSTLLLSLAFVPAIAFAVDFTDSTSRYSDAGSFTQAERAAVSVLTNVGAVQGNPDGTFAAARTLNRAEFSKIVSLTVPNVFGEWINTIDKNCFPDVHADDWFATPICGLKNLGVVQGYPDGNFHPEQSVNYAEAVKMLVALNHYTLPTPAPTERWAWYTGYIRAGDEHGVLLSENPEPGAFITRGQMARLAAAFLSEVNGALEDYRNAEEGVVIGGSSSESSDASNSESSSSSSVDSQSSSAVSVSSSSSSTSSSRKRFPAISHQILLGQASFPIADGIVRPSITGDVRIVTFNFRQEISSVQGVSLVGADGHIISDLVRGRQDPNDHKYRTWEAVLPAGVLHLTAGTDTMLGFTVTTKTKDGGGIPNQLIEPVSFSVILQEEATGTSEQLIPTNTHFPASQTVQSLLTSIQNVKPSTGDLAPGKRILVASFQFGGTVLDGADLSVTQLMLSVESSGLNLSNWYIMTTDRPDQMSCGATGTAPSSVACDGIGSEAGHVGTGIRTLNVYADVALSGSPNPATLRVSLGDPGTLGKSGAITWSDGAGSYNWLDLSETTVRQGTLWRVHQ